MIFTPKFPRAVLSLLTAFLVLLSVESRAAYRFRTRATVSEHSAHAEQIFNLTSDSKPPLVNYRAFKKYQQLVTAHEPKHQKDQSSKLALIFGGIAFLSFVAGYILIHTVLEPYSATILILAWGLFGILLPLVFGSLAITYGVEGIKAKKKKNMAIAGLVMGVLGIALGVALFAL